MLERLIDHVGLEQLEQARDRLPRVSDWTALLADLTAPAQPPAEPDFLLPIDFDPTPIAPFEEGSNGLAVCLFYTLQQVGDRMAS